MKWLFILGKIFLVGNIVRDMMKVDMWDELPVMFKVMILSEDKVQKVLEVHKQAKVYAMLELKHLKFSRNFLMTN